MGFGGLRVANIFALRSTDPDVLYTHPDPVGPDNDDAIVMSCEGAGLVVCAWGGHGNLQQRGSAVLRLLFDAGYEPRYLQMNADGTPRHPLYVGYSVVPKLWSSGAF
jgi:hypothetical protein